MRRIIIGFLLLAAALAAPATASAAPTISAGDVSVIEGDSGTTTAHFTLALSVASATDVTVQYATVDGTATAPSDYASKSGTATIAAGSLTTQVDVPVSGDLIDEGDETFSLHLSGASASADGDGTGTILDDDPVPTLSVNDNSVTEANTVNRAITFTVHLSTASARPVSVHYATADGSALAGADYQAASGDLSFAPGTTSRTVSVRVLPDVLDEPTETFRLVLSAPANAIVADGTGIGSIADNDPAPSLSVNDVRVREGGTAVFTVTLSHVSGWVVSVQYATAGGTAETGLDFRAAKGRVSIPPGARTAQVFVPTFDDGVFEPTETFSVALSRASHASIGDAHGAAAIIDNDRPPRPVVSALTIRPRAFRAARPRPPRTRPRPAGARVSYRLSAAASAHFGVERVRLTGRVTRLRGGFSVASHGGLNAFRFNGRLGGRRLGVGRYRLVLVAVGRAGRRSPASRVAFRILP